MHCLVPNIYRTIKQVIGVQTFVCNPLPSTEVENVL